MFGNQTLSDPIRSSFLAIRKRLHFSLSTSLLLTIFITTFLLVGVGSFILYTFTIQRVNQLTENTLMGMAATYEDALHYPLMINNMDLLQKTVFDIGNQNQAEAVRLLNQEGVVIASSVPDETGIRLDRNESLCQTCHTSNSSETMITESKSFTNSNQDVILIANPIENRIACQSCHNKASQILGLLYIEFPRGQLGDWQSFFDVGFVLGTLLLATLIASVIYSIVASKVIRPLRRLTSSSGFEPVADSENEIEQLSRRVMHMGEALAEKEEELASEHRKIDHLFSLQYNTENPPSLEKFFRQSLAIIQEITGFTTVALRLYEPRSQTFRLMAQSGMTAEMLKELQTVSAEAGYHAEIIQTLKPVFTSDIPHDPRLSSNTPISAGYRSLACIPLLAQDVLVGSMQLVTREEYSWSENDQRWLGLIGRRIGMLIQQIQLVVRLRDLAVLEERSRIAQEIHDGLAQLIGAMRVWSEEALTNLEDGELNEVQIALEKIEGTASDAYASLREELLGLRDQISPNKELPIFLAEYLRRFQRQWGIQSELQVDERAGDLHPGSITPIAEIQLLRIFQEALTNVRRHANATWIVVALTCVEGALILRILDDGAGFDPQSIPDDRLGLRIMRERAASAGGSIAIASQIGQGTQLEVKMPLRISQSIEEG